MVEFEAPEPVRQRVTVGQGSVAVDGVEPDRGRRRRRPCGGVVADPAHRGRWTTLGRLESGLRGSTSRPTWIAKYVYAFVAGRKPVRRTHLGEASGSGVLMTADHYDETADAADAAPRGPFQHRGGRRHPRRAAWSSSSTTRTARTRATSSSPPRRSRPRRSTSWPSTAAGSSACRSPRAAATSSTCRRWSQRQHATPSAPRSPSPSTPRKRRHHRHLRRRPRATIQVAVDPTTRPGDLCRPGHINPLRAREGGVLVRAGQTEGSVDLARLAGLKPAGVICEIMNDDGTMARGPDLRALRRRARAEDRAPSPT